MSEFTVRIHVLGRWMFVFTGFLFRTCCGQRFGDLGIDIMEWKLVVPFWSVVVRLIFHGMESVGFKQQYMASGW